MAMPIAPRNKLPNAVATLSPCLEFALLPLDVFAAADACCEAVAATVDDPSSSVDGSVDDRSMAWINYSCIDQGLKMG